MRLPHNYKLALAYALITIPSRLIVDKRLRAISTEVKERIPAMIHQFIAEGLMVDSTITAIDKNILKTNGHGLHRSDTKKE